MDLQILDISDMRDDDGQDFFMKNDIDLTCPTCKGSQTRKVKPENAKIIPFTASEEDKENMTLAGNWTAKDLDVGDDYFKIVGSDQYDATEAYETEQDAQDALDDEEKWEEDGCDDCSNGYLEVMWNTIWNTGFHSFQNGEGSTQAHGPIIAFEYNGNIWFGLMGCGMDMSPHLVAAWFHFFPDCSWIPDQWINETNLYGGYYASLCGKEIEDKIFAILKDQLVCEISQKQYQLKRLKEYLKGQKAKVQKKA